MKFISWCFILMIVRVAFAKEACPDDVELLWRLSNSVTAFAISLHKKLAERPGGNLIFSPFTITSTLGMLHLGARGKTARELDKALIFDKVNITRSQSFRGYKSFFKCLFLTENSRDSVFDVVNGIFINKHEVNLNYMRRALSVFQVDPVVMDFSGDAQKFLTELNSWVQGVTKNKVKSLIDHLDPGTDLVIASAAYFLGRWSSPFEHTRRKIFYNGGTKEKYVDMMEQIGYFNYASCTEMTILELNFQGGKISMVFILPNRREGLKRLEQARNYLKILECFRTVQNEKVQVVIPKFNASIDVELSKTLKTLGAVQIFDPLRANFTGMLTSAQVAVGEIAHKAFITVDELGVEAAAVTAAVSTRSLITPTFDKYFCADSPFVYLIIQKRMTVPLFMGRVWSL